jgi:hypothetical protein
MMKKKRILMKFCGTDIDKYLNNTQIEEYSSDDDMEYKKPVKKVAKKVVKKQAFSTK